MIELQIAAQALDNGGLLEGPPGPGAQQLPAGVLQWPAASLLQLVLALPEHLSHLCCYCPGIILPPKPVSLCTTAAGTACSRISSQQGTCSKGCCSSCLRFVTAKHGTAFWHSTTADRRAVTSYRVSLSTMPSHLQHSPNSAKISC